MPHGMLPGTGGSHFIERILESTIGQEVEMRQMDFYGEFGFAVSNAKNKLVDFRKYLRSNSAVYRLLMTHIFAFPPAEVPSLEETKQQREPVSTFEAVVQPQPKQQKPKKNALEIEGMDPLFMENLTSVGLQNIADSHQIHSSISDQARGVGPNQTG